MQDISSMRWSANTLYGYHRPSVLFPIQVLSCFFPLQCTVWYCLLPKIVHLNFSFVFWDSSRRVEKTVRNFPYGKLYKVELRTLCCQENACSRSFSGMSRSKLFLWQKCIRSVFQCGCRNIKSQIGRKHLMVERVGCKVLLFWVFFF